MDARTSELICSRSTPRPQFLYNYRDSTGELHIANLLTGEQSCHQLPGYKFKLCCRWSELPDGSLLITGGWIFPAAVRDVVKIDTLREWAVSSVPPMHTARCSHAAVYHAQYLYVLAGYTGESLLTEWERYAWAESMGSAARSASSLSRHECSRAG
jgi:hypothetical protein